VALDRASQEASAERHSAAHKRVAAPFRRHRLAAGPDTIHPGRTDHGRQLTHRSRDPDAGHHLGARVCSAPGIAHRRTPVHQPGTNGQGERMQRTLNEATVKPSHNQTQQPWKAHRHALQRADNLATRLNTRQGLTPVEDLCQGWHKEPERFPVNPCHHTLGLNT
jgi:hypothetical protein